MPRLLELVHAGAARSERIYINWNIQMSISKINIVMLSVHFFEEKKYTAALYRTLSAIGPHLKTIVPSP